jgi:hypothetical protein
MGHYSFGLFVATGYPVPIKRFFKSELSNSGTKNGRSMRFAAADFLDFSGHIE